MLHTYRFNLTRGSISSELRVVASSIDDATEIAYSFVTEGAQIEYLSKSKTPMCDEIAHFLKAGYTLQEIADVLYTDHLEKLYIKLARYTSTRNLDKAKQTLRDIKRLESRIGKNKRNKSLLPSISKQTKRTKKADALPQKQSANPDHYRTISFRFTQLDESTAFDDVLRMLDDDTEDGGANDE
jgi:hypothetical protein